MAVKNRHPPGTVFHCHAFLLKSPPIGETIIWHSFEYHIIKNPSFRVHFQVEYGDCSDYKQNTSNETVYDWQVESPEEKYWTPKSGNYCPDPCL